MRICHAVRSDGFAGVERHIQQLATAEVDAGHEVVVVGGDPERMRAGLPATVGHLPAATTLGVTAALGRAYRDHGMDVVNLHMTAAELGAALSVRTRRVPVVVTRHFAGARGSSPAVRLLAAHLRRRAAAQIAISHHVAAHIDGASTVVHSGVATRPDGRPAATRTATVLLLQRLEPEKDGALALAAFARSGLAEQGWQLDVAGDGALRAELEAAAARLGLRDRVRFLGHVADAPERMARAGLLIAPCPIEGLGLTVLEAMAAGLPVLAAAAGGHLETIGSVPGARLFAAGDVADAAAALAELAADPDRRDRIARAAVERQRRAFSLQHQQRGTEAVYRTVLRRREDSGRLTGGRSTR